MSPTGKAAERDQLKRLSVLIAVAGVDMLGFAMVLPLLPFYALKLNATPETIGAITASYSVAQLLAAPVWGRVSDHYGRRPALLAGLLASAVAFAIFGFASSVWLFFAMRLMVCDSVQGSSSPRSRRPYAYS